MMQQSVCSQWCTYRSCRGSWTLFWDPQSAKEEQLLPHRFCGDDVSPSQVISDMDSEVAHHSIDADSVCHPACCSLYSTVSSFILLTSGCQSYLFAVCCLIFISNQAYGVMFSAMSCCVWPQPCGGCCGAYPHCMLRRSVFSPSVRYPAQSFWTSLNQWTTI